MKRITILLSALCSFAIFAAPHKVLVILSGANEITLQNGKKHPTGHFLGELTEPLTALRDKGYELEFASPQGKAPTIDQESLKKIYWTGRSDEKDRALAIVTSTPGIQKPRPLEKVTEKELKNFSGLFVPGGHAPMVDLAKSEKVAKILQHFHEAKKPIGLICHAPVVLLSLKERKPWPFKGYRMTVFSKMEEKVTEAAVLEGEVPYYPSDALTELGAVIDNTNVPAGSNVVVDRELVTGQNPFSPKAFGKALVKALGAYAIKSTPGEPQTSHSSH